MKKIMNDLIRFGYLTIGSFLMAAGSKIATASHFGADVVVLVWEGLDATFGMDMGMANFMVSFLFLAATAILNRHHIGVGTVAGIFLQSWMLHWIPIDEMGDSGLLIRLLVMVIGIALIAMGCSFYAIARLGVGPYVGVILSGHDRFQLSITQVKFRLDLLCVVVALALGKFPSIGPLVSLMISGFIMDGTLKGLRYFLRLQTDATSLTETLSS